MVGAVSALPQATNARAIAAHFGGRKWKIVMSRYGLFLNHNSASIAHLLAHYDAFSGPDLTVRRGKRFMSAWDQICTVRPNFH